MLTQHGITTRFADKADSRFKKYNMYNHLVICIAAVLQKLFKQSLTSMTTPQSCTLYTTALDIPYMYEGIQSTYTHVLYILTIGQLIQVTLNKSLIKLK